MSTPTDDMPPQVDVVPEVDADVAAPAAYGPTDQFITSLALLTFATVCVWKGSKLALRRFLSPAHDDDTESMNMKDALKFPLVGSAVLFSLYLAFKFIPKDYLLYAVNAYFAFVGTVSLAQVLIAMAIPMIPAHMSKVDVVSWHFIPFWSKSQLDEKTGEDPAVSKIDLTSLDLMGLAAGAVVAGVYIVSKHWLLNNLIAVALCIEGIKLFRISSTKVGAVLLVLLFFYDVFWVFGTDVMVTVATKFDGPIKILWPRSLTEEIFKFSLLGLGDIVLPGVFVACVLRVDAFLAGLKPEVLPETPVTERAAEERPIPPFKTPLFNSVMVGYVFGLVLCMVVMNVFKHAQPALLYLVPTCIIFPAVRATTLGHFKVWVNYEDPEEKEEEVEKTREEKKNE